MAPSKEKLLNSLLLNAYQLLQNLLTGIAPHASAAFSRSLDAATLANNINSVQVRAVCGVQMPGALLPGVWFDACMRKACEFVRNCLI